MAPILPLLQAAGIVINMAGPGEHVPVTERMIQTIKSRVRCYEHSLPYVMCRVLLIMCSLFCVSRINMQPSTTSVDRISPLEKFSGQKLDAKVHLRCGFGEYVQATVPHTDNTLKTRTDGCITLLPTGNATGTVQMLSLSTNSIVRGDHYQRLPMPNQVVVHLNSIATRQGYIRGSMDPGIADDPDPLVADNGDPEFGNATGTVQMLSLSTNSIVRRDHYQRLPMPNQVVVHLNSIATRQGYIRGDTDVPVTTDDLVHTDQDRSLSDAAGVLDSSGPLVAPGAKDLVIAADDPTIDAPTIDDRRYPVRSSRTPAVYSERTSADIQQGAEFRSQWQDSLYAFKISVRKAMKERPNDAEPVIIKEMKQMLEKKVWHGKHMADLTATERSAVIRSSMFLKDKYLASGAFDKFKARLVGGGDGQDKSLYENLSSSTAATTSVFTIAAIAASENRFVETVDIGGAFLHADMKPTGVVVHMRLDKMMTSILVKIAPDYRQFINNDGTIVVQLDKALYGTVEAASL